MSSELRSALVGGIERAASYLALGNYGDPHTAYMVLVHADEPPTIVIIQGDSPHTLDVYSTDPDESKTERRSERETALVEADVSDAACAVGDLRRAISEWRYPILRTKGVTFGQFATGEIRKWWQQRRDAEMESAMKEAAYEASRPVKCQFCKRRFSERGYASHIARNRYCQRRKAEAEAKAAPGGAA